MPQGLLVTAPSLTFQRHFLLSCELTEGTRVGVSRSLVKRWAAPGRAAAR